MPSFAEWEAMRKGQGAPAVAAPVAEGGPSQPYQATQGDDYTSAFLHEAGRTAKEAAIGVARSPLDLVKGLFGIPGQVVEGYKQMLDHPDPSLLLEAPGAIKAGVKSLGDNPRDAGSLLGQMLLAPKVPGAAESVAAEGPGVVGRGMGAVGRGMEAVGTSKIGKLASKYGPLEAVLRGDPTGVAIAAAPKLLEYGGKGLQKGGAALEGLKRNVGKVADAGTSMPPTSPWDSATEKPYRMGGAADVNGARGWEQAEANSILRNAAKPSDALPGERPIDTFLRNDPQARTGGEGRMTGQFTEGSGGLSDIAAGRVTPRPGLPKEFSADPEIAAAAPDAELSPLMQARKRIMDNEQEYAQSGTLPDVGAQSPLDRLARLSGRQVGPLRAQELLDKLGGRGAGQ